MLAHEMRHVWQALGNPRRIWGCEGQDERDADAYALRMLRTYRSLGLTDMLSVGKMLSAVV
jgi:hypothetical protein